MQRTLPIDVEPYIVSDHRVCDKQIVGGAVSNQHMPIVVSGLCPMRSNIIRHHVLYQDGTTAPIIILQ